MLLATRQITTGDTRQIVVDYSEFLAHGRVLVTVAVTIVPATATSTVGNAYLDPSKTKALIYFTGGSVLNEAFTADVVVTDDNGETVHDTINFTVVSP